MASNAPPTSQVVEAEHSVDTERRSKTGATSKGRHRLSTKVPVRSVVQVENDDVVSLASVKLLLQAARRKGYVTHKEIESRLASDNLSADQVDEVMVLLD